LNPGESPCSIITLPIGHDDHHSIVKDASFDLQNNELKKWALNGAESTAFYKVLQRQRDLVADMQLFTPWPHQQCEACSNNQCADGVPMGKCCWTNVTKSNASTSCRISINIADTKDITQVVAPAAHSPDIDRPVVFKAQSDDGLIIASDLHGAFEKSNAALFIVARPGNLDRMMSLAENKFKLSRERIVVVPAVRGELAPKDSELVERGFLSQSYWDNVFSQYPEFSRGRLGCYLAHTRAHKMFLDSTFDVALFLEDDIDEAFDIDSESWQRNAYSVFTSDMTFGQTQDPAAVYLGYCSEGCPSSAQSYDLGNDLALRDADNPMCSHAYATNRKASEAFMSGALPMADPVDLVLPLIFKAKGVKSYIVNPPMLWQTTDATQTRKAAFCDTDDEDCGCTSTVSSAAE
jgi:hypothetical protein